MESFLVDLKKDVQCSLCDDTLTEPKLLSCFHTFCKPCIKRHAELIDQVNIFNCPQCNSHTSLPEPNSVEDLQPSLLQSRILKGLTLVEGKKVCSVSGSHLPASWYCFDCDRSICDECNKYHSEFNKDHKVVRLAELKKEDIEFIITRENPCKSHPLHRLESFCEDCDEMICLACWKQDHKEHKTIALDDFSSNRKAVLSRHLQVLEQLRLDDKEKQYQEKIANKIKQQGEKAKKEVQEKTKNLIQMLQENERVLLKQIDKNLDTATTNLNIIHHIPAVKEYIKKVMERGLASDMISIQGTQCSEKFIFNPIPLSFGIAFFPNQDLEQQVKTGLGNIQPKDTETDHTMSTIQVEGELEAARQQNLILKSKTSTGMDSINAGDVVDVQISPEGDMEIEETDVRTGGRIEVGFMAKVAGQLTADVQVNGSRVSNSPLVMNVKPHEMKITGQFIMNGVNERGSQLGGIAVNRNNSRIAIATDSIYYKNVGAVKHAKYHILNMEGNHLMSYRCEPSIKEGQSFRSQGMAFLNDADLVIADCDDHKLHIVNTVTEKLLKTFSFQGSGDEEFFYPYAVNVDDNGNIIVCDRDNHRVQVFTRDGDYQYQFGLTTQDIFDPVHVITHDGLFYVSDNYNHVVHVFEKKGMHAPTRILTIGGHGSADGQLNSPLGLAIDNDNHLLVCDTGNGRVQKFTLDGRFIGKTCDEIKNPKYITSLDDGQILVTSTTHLPPHSLGKGSTTYTRPCVLILE